MSQNILPVDRNSTKKDSSVGYESMMSMKGSTILGAKGPEPNIDQSASTLQHSAITWKFPKAERFPPIKNSSLSKSVIQLPSTLNQRSTSFGYGNKVMMSELIKKTGWEVPSPNHYTPKVWTENSNSGKTFGLSFTAYRKVYNPHADIVVPEIAKDIPGPGAYSVLQPLGSKSVSATLKPRGKMFNDITEAKAPASNFYSPSHSLLEPARYKGVGFGLGGRSDFTKDGNQSPGPGSYTIGSKFDASSQRRVIEEKLRARLQNLKI